MKIKKTIISGVVSLLIVGLITTLIHYKLPEGWTTVFHYLNNNILVSRWIWWLSIIANGLLVLVLGIIIFLIAAYRSEPDESIKYTHDTFFNIRWRWRYTIDDIYDLCSFCPDCDMQIEARPKAPPDLVPSSSFIIVHPNTPDDSIVYQCNDCEWDGKEFDFSKSEVEKRVKLKIQQKLRSKSR